MISLSEQVPSMARHQDFVRATFIYLFPATSIDVIGVPAKDFTGKMVSAETTRAGSGMLGP